MSKQQFKDKSIYDYPERIIRTWRLFENEFSYEMCQLIKGYEVAMYKDSLSLATQHKQIQVILNLCRMLKKEWRDATAHDIDDLVVNITKIYSNERGLETHTSHDHKKILKIFFRWFKLGSRSKILVGDPEETRLIQVKNVPDKIVREDLIDDVDLPKLLKACTGNARDRAIIAVHYEAGTRAGELLSLKLKHVKFDNVGAIIHVDGKTGTRPIRLITSVPYLSQWYNAHPFKEDQNYPLWIILKDGKFGAQLTYAATRMIFQRRAKQANLGKRVYMHIFRHGEATRTANYMTDAQMRKRHGWSANSTMPSKYSHLVNADVERVVLEQHGIVKSKSNETTVPIVCNICKTPNAFDTAICEQCGRPLSEEEAHRIDVIEAEKAAKKQEKLDREMKEMRINQAKIMKALKIEQSIIKD